MQSDNEIYRFELNIGNEVNEQMLNEMYRELDVLYLPTHVYKFKNIV